jgi:HK97 family phage major capsid protein
VGQNPVLQRLVDERSQTNENIDRILDQANDEERDPSDSERELITRYRTRLTELEPQIGELLDLEETREQARDARSALSRTRRRVETPGDGDDEPQPPPDEPEGEYRTFAQYARDQAICRFNYVGAAVDPGVRQRAQQRLQRAVETVLTTDVPGLIPPQYVREIVGLINKYRPIVDTARSIALTSGQIQYPRIGTRPTVAEQVTQKTEVGVGTMTVTMATKVAKTFLSAANMSWQTVQWSSPDALQLWFDLAAEDYAKKTEADAAALLAAVDTTPTTGVANDLASYVSAITAAAGRIYAATGRRANVIYADVTSGYKLLGLTAGVAPVFLGTGAANLATGQYPAIAGLQLVISPGLPANTIIVGDSSALLVAETAGAPVELRMVEPSIGGIEIGIIGAFLSEVVETTAFEELTPA